MSKSEISRRKFLGRSGTAALALPLAAAIPAAIEATSPKAVKAASMEDTMQLIPNRTLTNRNIGPTTAPIPTANLPANGTSDASLAIQNAINGLPTGGGTVIIPWQNTGGNQCVYMLDVMRDQDANGHYFAISMNSNVRLECEPGVKLQAMTANTGSVKTDRAYMINCNGVQDIEIANCWLVGERYTHVYSTSTSTDEHFYGISISNVTGMNVRATQISDCTGDGICLGGSPSDIVLCDVLSTGNRRQAISITSGTNIYLYDSEFSYTSGTLPMDGIDIEPQGSASVNGVTIENCIIKGNGGCGIQLNAQGTNISNVNVKNCLVSYNEWTGFVAQMGTTQSGKVGSVTTGSIYGSAFFQNGQHGISLTGTTSNYTVGANKEYGNYSNSFGNNKLRLPNDIQYPNQTKADTYGYVSGNDMNVSSNSLSSGTVVHWNTYYTP